MLRHLPDYKNQDAKSDFIFRIFFCFRVEKNFFYPTIVIRELC